MTEITVKITMPQELEEGTSSLELFLAKKLESEAKSLIAAWIRQALDCGLIKRQNETNGSSVECRVRSAQHAP